MKKILSKLINDPFLLISLPLSLPFIILIILISPVIHIRIGLINCDRIGHFAANTELYLCRKKYEEKNFLDIFYFPSKVSNKQLEKMIKREIYIFPKIIVRPFDLIIRSFKLLRRFNPIKTNFGDHDIYNYLDKRKNIIKFNREEKKKGNDFLKKINLYKKKYVCLTIRDEKYVEKNWKNKKTMDYHKHRNMEIDDFIPMCKYLNQQGFFVVRMGSDVKKKMSYSNPKFIDYSVSDIKSDFLDIYILANCYFNVSSVMGLDAIPFIFRKPILYLSSIPIGHFSTSSKRFLNVTLNHYDKLKKKNLSTTDIFKKGCGFLYSKKEFENRKIKLVSYKKNEIKLYTVEMLKFVKSNFVYSKNQLILNNYYWDNYKKNIKEYKLSNFLHGKIKSKYSIVNLNKNKHFLR